MIFDSVEGPRTPGRAGSFSWVKPWDGMKIALATIISLNGKFLWLFLPSYKNSRSSKPFRLFLASFDPDWVGVYFRDLQHSLLVCTAQPLCSCLTSSACNVHRGTLRFQMLTWNRFALPVHPVGLPKIWQIHPTVHLVSSLRIWQTRSMFVQLITKVIKWLDSIQVEYWNTV